MKAVPLGLRCNTMANKDLRKYTAQRLGAKRRGIDWQLTFDSWMTWWQSTGHYHERGVCKGGYVMARFGDTGPYSLTNIKCILATDNVAEVNRKYKALTEEQKLQRSINSPLNKPIVTPLGKFRSAKEAADKHGVAGSTIRKKIITHPQDYYYPRERI